MDARTGTIVASLLSAALVLAPPARAGEAEPRLPQLVRASDLVDQSVEDRRSLHVGALNDLLIDPQSGRIVFAVVDAGGRFEAPKGPLALALPDAKVYATKGNLHADMSLRDMRGLPSIDEALGELDAATRARLVSASALLDASLVDASGGDIGDVEDLALDIARARVAYAVVSQDKSWYSRDKLAAIAFGTVRRGADGSLALVADPKRVREAPAFDAESPPRLADASLWYRFLHAFGLS